MINRPPPILPSVVLGGVALVVGSVAADPSVSGGLLAGGPALEAGAQERVAAEGSSVPCDAPLTWRIAELDERFGLTREEAEDAVRLAGMLWEGGRGRMLFAHDPAEGMPIRFVYDARQEEVEGRRRATAELESGAAELAPLRTRVESLRNDLANRRAEHDRRVDAYEGRLAQHLAEVAYWNERGGAPPAELERLEHVGAELERERRAVNRSAEELNRRVQEVNEETRRLNERVAEQNRTAERLAREFPAGSMQTGEFRETSRRFGPFRLSLEREISIFRFQNRAHLVLVIAHELGHALGLGHTGVNVAVMADVVTPPTEGSSPALHRADLALFSATCPDL